MKVAILTDSASNLLPSDIENYDNLFVLPLGIVIDGKTYRDQVEISAKEVYDQLDTHQISTSLPSTADFIQLLDKIKGEGYDHVMILSVSSGLSGTFNAFRLVSEDYEGLTFTLVDTKTLGAGQGFMVLRALEWLKDGKTPEEIVPMLTKLRFEDSLAIYTINTLKYLRRGGRIGKVEGTIGDILHVKPIITVNDEGIYITLAKSLGMNRSLLLMKQLLENKFKNSLIDLVIHFGNEIETAKELGSKLLTQLNIRKLVYAPLTPVLGIHTGPQMIAYVACKV
jgi:DegV family protein with EDD domain